MKKIVVIIAAITAALLMLTACGPKGSDANKNGNQTTNNNQVENKTDNNDSKEGNDKDSSTTDESGNKEEDLTAGIEGMMSVPSPLTATITDIKDSMFVVKDDVGGYFAFSLMTKLPFEIAEFKVGDRVKIEFEGELTQIDAFTGEIISMEKVTE